MRTAVSQTSAGAAGAAAAAVGALRPALRAAPDRHTAGPRQAEAGDARQRPRGDPPGVTQARAVHSAPVPPMPPHWASLVQTVAASTGGNNASPTPRPADIGSPRNAIRASFTIPHFGPPGELRPSSPRCPPAAAGRPGCARPGGPAPRSVRWWGRRRARPGAAVTGIGQPERAAGSRAVPGVPPGRRRRRRPAAPPGAMTLGLLQAAPGATSATSTADRNSAVRIIVRLS